jgi:serine/threonine protein kinase
MELIEMIGEGGFGQIYLARYKEELVAFKTGSSTFEREVAIMKLLKDHPHPNIIKYYDVATSNLGSGIILEYIPGLTLNALVTASSMTANEHFWFQSVIHCLEGIKHLHSLHIYHSDITVNNIMYQIDRTQPRLPFRAVLIDFGISCSDARNVPTKANCYRVPGRTPFPWPYGEFGDQNYICDDIWGLGESHYILAYKSPRFIKHKLLNKFTTGHATGRYIIHKFAEDGGGFPVPYQGGVSPIDMHTPSDLSNQSEMLTFFFNHGSRTDHHPLNKISSPVHSLLRMILFRETVCWVTADMLLEVAGKLQNKLFNITKRTRFNPCELPCEDQYTNESCKICPHCKWVETPELFSKHSRQTSQCRPRLDNTVTQIWNPYRKTYETLDGDPKSIQKRYGILFTDENISAEEIIKNPSSNRASLDVVKSRIESAGLYHPLTMTKELAQEMNLMGDLAGNRNAPTSPSDDPTPEYGLVRY